MRTLRLCAVVCVLAAIAVVCSQTAEANERPKIIFSSPHVAQWTTLDIGNWLDVIGLSIYKFNFLQAGIDGALLTEMTDAQLQQLLEDDPQAFDTFVSEFQRAKSMAEHALAAQAKGELPDAVPVDSLSAGEEEQPLEVVNGEVINPLSRWGTEDVARWLHSIEFGVFTPLFKQEQIDGKALLSMTDLSASKLFGSNEQSLEEFKKARIQLLQHFGNQIQMHLSKQKQAHKAAQEAEKQKAQQAAEEAHLNRLSPQARAMAQQAKERMKNQRAAQLANDPEYLQLLSRPAVQWTLADVSTFLRKLGEGLERYISHFVAQRIDGETMVHLDKKDVKHIFDGDEAMAARFISYMVKVLRAQRSGGEAGKAPSEDEMDTPSLLIDPNMKSIETMDREEQGALEQIQRNQSALFAPRTEHLKENPVSCAEKHLSPAQLLLFQKLKVHLAQRKSHYTIPANYTTEREDPTFFLGEQGVGCPRMLRQALPQRDSSRKLMVLFGTTTVDVHEFMHERGWANLTMLSFDSMANEEWDLDQIKTNSSSYNLDDLYFNLDPIVGTCALYHMGIIPDVIYVQDTVLHKVFIQTSGGLSNTVIHAASEKQYKHKSCGCLDWYRLWKGLPSINRDGSVQHPIIMGDFDKHTPKFLNSIATRTLKNRIYVDAPCWAISDQQNIFNPHLGVHPDTQEPIAPLMHVEKFSCNDTLGDGLLPLDIPLLSAFMVVDPVSANQFNAFSARVAATIESVAPHVDNFLFINLVEDGGSLEDQAKVYSVLKREIARYATASRPNFHHKILQWKLADFENSKAKLKNEVLKYLSGRSSHDEAHSSDFYSVYQLAVNADEVLEKGEKMRLFLQQHRNLCGVSEHAMQMSVFTGGSSISLESRIFRTANHLSMSWDPNHSTDEHQWGYISSANEIYVNMHRERYGFALPGTGRLAPTSTEGFQFGFNKQIVQLERDRFIRYESTLAAQKIEMNEKKHFWNDLHPAKTNKTQPDPPAMPLKWSRVLAHTLYSLGEAYEIRGQLTDAYPYYLQRMIGLIPTPYAQNFSKEVENPHVIAKTLLWKRFEGDEYQACASLYKLYKLHPIMIEQANTLPKDIQALLLPIRTRIYTFENLQEYYAQQLVRNCGEHQLEALYSWIEHNIKKNKWHVAHALIDNMQKSSMVNTYPCRLDLDICVTKLPQIMKRVSEHMKEEIANLPHNQVPRHTTVDQRQQDRDAAAAAEAARRHAATPPGEGYTAGVSMSESDLAAKTQAMFAQNAALAEQLEQIAKEAEKIRREEEAAAAKAAA